MTNTLIGAIQQLDINKFVLQAFHHLAFNYEISGSLVANMLLDFLKFYTSEKTIKKVNL